MRLPILAAVLSLVSAAPRAQPVAATGAISGRVDAVLNGKQVPPPKGEMYVWLVDTNRAHKRPASEKLPRASIRQIGTEFDPHVLVVPKGTEVDFPNQAREDHNVFSPNPYFDLGRYGSGKSESHKFDVLGPEFEIYCDIHKCMWARVKVVDVLKPAYIQPVDASGQYRFDHIEPGTYKVYAWAVASKEVPSGEITVADKPVTAPELHVQLGTLDTQHKNKDGAAYTKQYAGCRL